MSDAWSPVEQAELIPLKNMKRFIQRSIENSKRDPDRQSLTIANSIKQIYNKEQREGERATVLKNPEQKRWIVLYDIFYR